MRTFGENYGYWLTKKTDARPVCVFIMHLTRPNPRVDFATL